MGDRIIKGRLNYLDGAADGVLAGDTDKAREIARGLKQVIAELREVYGRAEAVEAYVSEPATYGGDVYAEKVLELLNGPQPAGATPEEVSLWTKYFDNDYNRKFGWHEPKAGFKDKNKQLFLRCNRCAFMNGGWVHVQWHEVQPEWKTERMLIERKEKLGE